MAKEPAKAAHKAPETAPKAAETPAIEVVAAQTAPKAEAKAAKTTAITFLRSHSSYAYWPGDKAEVEAEKAKELIAGGFAE